MLINHRSTYLPLEKTISEGWLANADQLKILQLISDRPTVHGPWVFNPADLLSNAASQRNRRLANNVDDWLANLHTTDALIIHSVKNLSCASFQAWGAYKKRSLRSAWVSAVDLCHEWPCLFICQNWSDFPVETFRPFSSMFITSIGIIRFDQNPTLDRAWTMETLPWFALRERSTSCQEFSCSNFVVSGFERPVHQKGHWRWVVYFAYFPTTWVKKPVKDDTLVVKTIGEMLSSSVNSVPAPHRPWAGQIISRCSVTQRNLISVVARWFPSWSGTYQWILVFPILIKFRFLLCFFLVK